MSVGSPKNSVFDYLKLIKEAAVHKDFTDIPEWCDKAAEIIDDYNVDGKACRRDRISPLDTP